RRWDCSRVFRQVVDIFRLELMLQLGLATLLGGAIGLKRELGGKPAGLRTNILICIGSVLYTHLSLAMLAAANGGIPPGTDTTRVAAQIVIELELRGSKRLYDQAIVTLLHHDHVRTVSTGE